MRDLIGPIESWVRLLSSERPVVWQELAGLMDGMRCDAREHIAEPYGGVDVHRSQEATKVRSNTAAVHAGCATILLSIRVRARSFQFRTDAPINASTAPMCGRLPVHRGNVAWHAPCSPPPQCRVPVWRRSDRRRSKRLPVKYPRYPWRNLSGPARSRVGHAPPFSQVIVYPGPPVTSMAASPPRSRCVYSGWFSQRKAQYPIGRGRDALARRASGGRWDQSSKCP
jgi:hypothetical protein